MDLLITAVGEETTTFVIETTETSQCGVIETWAPLITTTTKPNSAQSIISSPQPTLVTDKNHQKFQISDVEIPVQLPKGGGSQAATLAPSINTTLIEEVCGTVTTTKPLIVRGTPTTKGAFPWLVAIYFQQSFVCGGNLISNKHILTAGHCITENSVEDIDDFDIFLGKYKLNDLAEAESVQAQVENVFIHPDYEKFSKSKAEADLAVFVVREIEFSNYVSSVVRC